MRRVSVEFRFLVNGGTYEHTYGVIDGFCPAGMDDALALEI